MRKICSVSALLTCLLLLCAARAAVASCVGYREVNQLCLAKNCSDEFTQTLCSWGCVSGLCVNQGGSGLCCGVIYYNAQIQPDGTHVNCGSCGEARVHVSRSSSKASNAEIWRGAVLGVRLNQSSSYRMPHLLIVPDRCAHGYGLVVEDGRPVAAGGL
jgi:hypothetical protein